MRHQNGLGVTVSSARAVTHYRRADRQARLLVPTAVGLESSRKDGMDANAVFPGAFWNLRPIETTRAGRGPASRAAVVTVPAVVAGALGTVGPSGLRWHAWCELAAGEADQAGPLTVVASTMAAAAAQCLAWVVVWVPQLARAADG